MATKELIVRTLFALILGAALSCLMLCTGCNSSKPASKSDSTIIQTRYIDSTTIKVIERDSIVFIDSLRIIDSIDCNENQVYRINRNGDTFIIRIVSGKVHFDANLKGTISRFNSRLSETDRRIDSVDRIKIVKEETKVIDKSGLPFHKLWLWPLYVLALYGLISLLWNRLKLF